MRVLLGSGGFRTPERIQNLTATMRAFFGPIRQLLFVPYALADHDAYVRLMYERGLDAGYELVGLHTFPDPYEAAWNAEGIFVGGGNTFRLLDGMYRNWLFDVLPERVLDGLPYLGVSAGCNVACPSIRTTNDMPIVQPRSLEALDLVPFQVNPHYVTGMMYVKDGDEYIQHYSETRDDRIREFHEENDSPVIGLWEGGILWIEDETVKLSAAPARVFRKGQPPVDAAPGAELSELLK